jgi:hypothetical protein
MVTAPALLRMPRDAKEERPDALQKRDALVASECLDLVEPRLPQRGSQAVAVRPRVNDAEQLALGILQRLAVHSAGQSRTRRGAARCEQRH